MDLISAYSSDSDSDTNISINKTPSLAIVAAPAIVNDSINDTSSQQLILASQSQPSRPESLGQVETIFVDDRLFQSNYRESLRTDSSINHNDDSSELAKRKLDNQTRSSQSINQIAANQPITAEQLANRAKHQAKRQKREDNASADSAVSHAAPSRPSPACAPESSQLHISNPIDYAGRSYLHPPSWLKLDTDWLSGDVPCHKPKSLLHTFRGHTDRVNRIRFIPRSGHLLLSSSFDMTCKLWRTGGDNQRDYECVRTFAGHSKAIREIDFNHDGTKFMSVSYDHWVKIWDTETGQCTSRHCGSGMSLTARFHPHASKNSNEFLAGQSNRLVCQWDVRANQVVTEYNEHLDAINSLTFIEDAQRFVSSSDDKKVFIWDYGIPVVIKHISDPALHSITSLVQHPSQSCFIGASQENALLVFDTKHGKYKWDRRKRFTGSTFAGYACNVACSNDGKYVMQGDASGVLYIWDYQNRTKLPTRIKCHTQVLMDAQWNPASQSRVATASLDGLIKYWD